jgi:hypothetical protein
VPFQRLYIINAPHIIQSVECRANRVSFVSNLLDFGILYSGVTKRSENLLREAYRHSGNSFTAIVHKTLLSKVSLMSITSDAVNILNKDLANTISQRSRGGF